MMLAIKECNSQVESTSKETKIISPVTDKNRGKLLSIAGPPPAPPTGCILDDPELVWTEVID